MKKNVLFILIMITQWGLTATGPPSHLSGKSLQLWLKQNCYDGLHKTLGYYGANGARAAMYNYIDNKDHNNNWCLFLFSSKLDI